MGNLIFVFIVYWVSGAAGIPTVFLRTKEMALTDVERNFFSADYHAKRSIKALRQAIEQFFGLKQSTILLRSSTFLFLAAIACLVTLQFLYVGSDQLFSFLKNGFAVQLQPDEYERLHSFAGSSFDKLLTSDRFFHAGYFVLVVTAAFVFSYVVLSACSALAFLGVYRFVIWFSQDKPLDGSRVLLRLLRLLALILVADGIFLLLSIGTPFVLGRVVDIHSFQRADVQDWPMQDHPGPHNILVYSVDLFRNEIGDNPYVQYQSKLGVGPIAPSDIAAAAGTPRPILDWLLGTGGHYPLSTDQFCLDAGVTNRLECRRRLTDVAFARIRDAPKGDLLGLAHGFLDAVGKIACLDTDVGQRDIWQRDIPSSGQLAFKMFVPFLATIVLVWWFGALLVPILGCLYLLNRIAVRIGKWQIARSHAGFDLMAKHGWTLLALPLVVLLALLKFTHKMYCGG